MEMFINSSYFYKLMKFIVKIYILKRKEKSFGGANQAQVGDEKSGRKRERRGVT